MKIVINMLLIAVSITVLAQTNYEEAKVPSYTLPDPLVSESGKHIRTVFQWEKHRRPEVLALFEQHVYGRTLGGDAVAHEVIAVDGGALGGLATRREIGRASCRERVCQYV